MALDPKWKDTVQKGINDVKWDKYDKIIKAEVDAYALKFSALASQVNWLLIKAMLWTESGGPSNSAWETQPLQIGNPGDPGYDVLKNSKEGSDLIMSAELKKSIADGLIKTGEVNVKAAIAYLYTRMALTDIISLRDLKDTKQYEYTVVAGDNLEKIATKTGSTVFELRRLNPKSSVLYAKNILKYVKAKMQRTIVGWRDFNADNVADKYNGGGDPDYSAKLTYVLKEIFPKLVRGKKP